MKIHSHFTGGNIVVDRMENDTVYLERDLRDTEGDWFYWAFCVEGAAGRTLTFTFPSKHRVGRFGAAVSHDLADWHWSESGSGNTFTYTFAEGENKVYFAHNMLYLPARFDTFCTRMGLAQEVFCRSVKGRDLPAVRFGTGDKRILLTARHHACEATGSYVLEGVTETLIDLLPAAYSVLIVPFVDYDGVVDGDQGKNRRPHDHNRDYIDDTLYPEVRAIRSLVENYGCHFCTDFHSPGHLGKQNDTIFVVRNMTEKLDRFERFSDLLAAEITPNAMDYKKENDYPPCTSWNQPSPNCAYMMNCRPDCDLSFSLESAYFGTPENKISQERLIALGHCFAKAMKAYLA